MEIKSVYRIVITGLSLFLMSTIAFSDEEHPVDIAIPSIVSAGSSQNCVINVSGSGTAHLYSIPQGVVNVDVAVQNGQNYVSVPFSQNYVGLVTVYATVNNNTQVVGATSVVLPN
jgi:hypothetical protein